MHFLSCLRMTSDLTFFHRCTSLPGSDKTVQKPNDYSAKKVLCLHLYNIPNALRLAGLHFPVSFSLTVTSWQYSQPEEFPVSIYPALHPKKLG